MTLTQTAAFARRSIVGFIIFSFVSVSAFIGYRIWSAYQEAHKPPIEEKPSVSFGSLPLIQFPKGKSPSSKFSYSLDTVTGGLPSVDKLIKVYFIPKALTTFLSADRSKALAEKFGIATPPTIVSDTRYSFSDGGKTLTIDLDSGNFNYTASASTSAELPADEKKLVVEFKSFLSGIGVFKKELGNGPSKVRRGSEGTQVQVSLWPEKIDDKPVLTADINKSLVNAVMVGPPTDIGSYQSIDFTFWPVDTTTFATYPLKNSQQAFEALKQGQGVIIIEPQKLQVSITSVYLAYFEQETYTSYLQPIYVFEGPGFVAYVQAVADDQISQTK